MNYNQGFYDYAKYISGIKKLDTKTERALIQKAQNGNKNAKNKLIDANLYIVLVFVKRLMAKGLINNNNAMDCMQQGSMGLMRAIKKFDLSMDNKLSTYATFWIRQQIKETIRKESTITIPHYVYKNKEKVINLADYRYLKSLNEKINDDTETQLQEIIPDLTNNTENEVLTKAQRKEVNTILNNILTLREQDIIKRRFGFYGKKETLESIGLRYNLSKEAIRLIEKKAMEKLKSNTDMETIFYN